MRHLGAMIRAAVRPAMDYGVCRHGGYRNPVVAAAASADRSVRRSLEGDVHRRTFAAGGGDRGERVRSRGHVGTRDSAAGRGTPVTRSSREARFGRRSGSDGAPEGGDAPRSPVDKRSAQEWTRSTHPIGKVAVRRAPAAAHDGGAAIGGGGGSSDDLLEERLSVLLESGVGPRGAPNLMRSVRTALAARVRLDGTWDRRMSTDDCASLVADICRGSRGEGDRSERAAEGALMHSASAFVMPERAQSLLRRMRARGAVTPVALAHLASVLSRADIGGASDTSDRAAAAAAPALSAERERLVLECVAEARQLQPLDGITASLLLEAAARTSQWRRFLPWTAADPTSAGGGEEALLPEDEISPEACRLLAVAAARDGRAEDACRLLALLHGRLANAPPFVDALLGVLGALSDDRKRDGSLSAVLDSMCNIDGLLLPDQAALSALVSACPPSWKVRESAVDHASGRCSCCGRELERRRELSADDVRRLSDAFVGASVVGSDAFLRSSPSEISSFRRHMESGGPYDVVIDGLNVAGKRYPGRTSTDRVPPKNGREFPFHRAQLAIVLDHFYSQKKKMLIVGKPPIASLLSDQWKRRVDYFVVNSVSQDDLFVVYAALLSGPQCYIVSEDQYKDHKKHLPHELQRLFVAWQGSRQICFVGLEGSESCKRPVFKMPTTHHGNAQRSSTGWHLPLDNPKEALLTYNVTPSWLCIDVDLTRAASATGADATASAATCRRTSA